MNESKIKLSIKQAISLAGQSLKEGKFAQAEARYRQILSHLPPQQVTEQLCTNLGIALANQRKLEEALASFRRAVELAPQDAATHANLANALVSSGQHSLALASFQRALQLRPDHVDALSNLGILQVKLGDIDAAVKCFENAIHHDATNANALFRLATTLRGRTSAEHVQQMESLLEDGRISGEKQALLYAGLTSIFDARQDHQRAAEHAEEANRQHKAALQSRGVRYDSDAYSRFADQFMTMFDAAYYERVRGFGIESSVPVFVFGLPRSGTSLVEQILAIHPKVHGAGEQSFVFDSFRSLPELTGVGQTPVECVARMDQGQFRKVAQSHLDRLRQLNERADRITNKLPDNYLLVGFIATLFPQATMIHCRRDLRDVATSCWLTHLHEVPWTNDQHHIAAHLNTYGRVMDHWDRVLPGRIHEVEYEDLVSNPDKVIPRMIESCQLPWDPVCLEVHTSDRPVDTASEVQARQPISTRSVARYKNFEPYLSEMFGAIAAD